MGKEARYKKELKEVEIYGTLVEEKLFLCLVHPNLCQLILACGTSCATPLGKNAPGNVYMQLIIQQGLPEMTYLLSCTQ